MPKRLSVPGMVIAGDAAGMVNVPTLKGIHYAMHAGIYAAEAIVEALKQDSVNFEEYERKVKSRRSRRTSGVAQHAPGASPRASSSAARWPAR